MSQSVISEWINENEFRGYPLRENTSRSIGATGLILDPIILDANLVFSGLSLPNEVKLTNLDINPTIAVFTVSNQPLFTIDLTNAVFPYYSRNSQGSLLVVGEAIKVVPTGNYTFPSTIFEDSVSVEMKGTWNGVSGVYFSDFIDPPVINTMQWDEGYQFDIKIKGNTIHLGADSNLGKPLSCEKFFEDTVDDDCDQLVSFINGASTISNPDIMRFVAGPNIVIYDDPPNNRIYIGLNFEKNDVCTTPISNPES